MENFSASIARFKQPHFRHGYAIQLSDPFRRNVTGSLALVHSFPDPEHDVESQFERPAFLLRESIS
jgi:hypothetical protein